MSLQRRSWRCLLDGCHLHSSELSLFGTFLVDFAQCLGFSFCFMIKGQSFWSGLPKAPLLFCWRAHWQDSGGAMIITAPICSPWNWQQQPVAPSGQGGERDSWTVRRRKGRGRRQRTEDTDKEASQSGEQIENGILSWCECLSVLCNHTFGCTCNV